MRTLSTNLKDHYAEQVRTIARCWYILRTDGTEFFFTSHDKDLVISGDTYKSLNSGQTTAIENKAGLSVDTLDIEMVLDSGEITEDDIQAGRFDHATVWIFEVNYEALADGSVTISYGRIGEVELFENRARVEFRSLSQMLNINIGRSYLAECDAQFGDARCGLDLDALGYTETGTVAVVTDRAHFTTGTSVSASTNYPDGHGSITFTSGANNGLSMSIKTWSGTSMVLVLPMPFNPTNGDTFTASYGCKKTLTVCRDTFDNVANFRGFPHLPGTDKMLETPDAQ